MDYSGEFVGQPAPIEAAQWFVLQDVASGYDVAPDAVWTIIGQDESGGVYVTTDGVVAHAFQSPTNQSWIVDSAQRCG